MAASGLLHSVPEKGVSGTEYPFRTVEACFLHRVLPKMRRVPQEAFLSTECVFRTVEAPLRYRMPQTAERRRVLPAANATTARKEKPSAKSAARDAAASKKITAKKFAIPPQICSMPPESSQLIPEILQCQPEMPIVPYRSLSQDVPIYKKSTLHRRKVLFGAENGARTRDLNLGKVALYQLSYFRNITPYLAVGITKVRSFF